ncbi:MAG: heavy metal-associated domain-containing protein [Ilumatobacter sp.]|uniref:heavy-metal-associated domain-containing protein n=1 Tax=Ilumatobacter sp. TaxID=1967498 RepID=UPI00329756D3
MLSTEYTVQGMTCDHCARAVAAEVTKIPGAKNIRVDVDAGRLTIDSDESIPVDAVVEAVEEAGFQVVGV